MFKKSLIFLFVVLTASALMLNCSKGGGGTDEETPPAGGGGGSASDITLPTSDSGSNAIYAKAAVATVIDQGFNAGSVLLLAQLMPEMEEPNGDPAPKDAGDGEEGEDENGPDDSLFGDVTVTPGVVNIESCKIGEYSYSDISCMDDGIENCSAALQEILSTATETTCDASQATVAAEHVSVNANISNSVVMKFKCPFSEFMMDKDNKCKDGSESLISYTMTVNFGSDPAIITYVLEENTTRDLPLGEKVYSVILPSGTMTVKVKGTSIFTALTDWSASMPSFTDCQEDGFSFTISADLKEISIKEGETALSARVNCDAVLFDVESVVCAPGQEHPAATFGMDKAIAVTIGDEVYDCGGTIIDSNYDNFFCAVSK